MMHRFRDEEGRSYDVSDKRLFKFAVSYIAPYKKLVGVSSFFIISSTLIGLVPELLIRRILDFNIPDGDFRGLYLSISLMASVYIFSWLLGFVYSYSTSKLGQTTIYDLRKNMYKKLLSQSQTYFDKHQSGKINSRLTNDLETLANFLGSSFVSIIAAIIQLIGIVIIMLILNLQLALISFGMVPLLILVAWFFSGPVRGASRVTRKTIANVTDSLSENISGAKVTKTFAREEKNLQEFEKVNKENYDASMNATKLFALIFPLMGLIYAFGSGIILLYSGYQAAIIGNQLFTVGLVATFLAYLSRFFGPVFQLSMFYSTYQSALASLERVYVFLNEDVSINEPVNPIDLNLDTCEIKFENVNFSYDKINKILSNLNVQVEGNKFTAIVGETGAGKSTFVKLIPRFYDLDSGTITIDNQDVTKIQLKQLRDLIGIVPQTTHLFNTTIMNNLRYGSNNISNEKVIEISKMIGLHDFINSLPLGYETVVNEGGRVLSEGTRQLVSFARALIKNPKILVLDEATSSLDPISEIRVQEALNTLTRGRTVIAIAHRLSTIRSAERILVFHQGKIIQDGTHFDLVRTSGKYQELYLKQLLSDEKLNIKVQQTD